jgi:hypothetical protein
MSTNEPGKNEEIQSLNADQLNVQELDDKLLDDVAGGLESAERELAASCSGHSCGNHWC